MAAARGANDWLQGPLGSATADDVPAAAHRAAAPRRRTAITSAAEEELTVASFFDDSKEQGGLDDVPAPTTSLHLCWLGLMRSNPPAPGTA